MTTKDIVFLRHGQSAFNAHWEKHKQDPFIRDAPLTEKGRGQARAAVEPLQDALRSLGVNNSEVFMITSPLSRAMETAVLACPSGTGHFHLWPEVREMVSACDDLGLPRNELRRSPIATSACGESLDKELSAIPECWWTVPERLQGVNSDDMVDAFRKNRRLFVEAEAAITPRRLQDICKRLVTVPERCVLIVAHGDLIRELTSLMGLSEIKSRGNGSRGGKLGWGLRNCEIRVARNIDLSFAGKCKL